MKNSRTAPVLGAILCLGVTGFMSGLAQGADVPNVVLVMADDLGWGDVRAFRGDSPILTPQLDAIAAHGLQFNRFYAASPVCSPTRGACLTGRHPHRYGIHTANHGHLRADEWTLAEALRAHGYTTGHFGKWHLGTLSPEYSGKGLQRRPRENYCTPGMSGFDTWFSTEFAVATWDPYEPAHSHLGPRHLGPRQAYDTRALYWHNGHNIQQALAGCDSRIIMDRALGFIRGAVASRQPFLSVIWFHAPHAPVVGGAEFRQLYPQATEDQQHYYAVVTALDAQIGRLRAVLRELGVAENTIVWFCSDNGPEGNPGPTARHQGSAGPFRGRKRSLYEGGIRVPALLEWPAAIPAARQTDVPCVTSDFLPTLLDVLQIPLPADRPYDGISLLPLIQGTTDRRPRPIAFRFHKQAALSDNRFKLVLNNGSRRPPSDNGQTPWSAIELYDLLADPRERHNLADQFPQVVAEMRPTLDAFLNGE